MSFDPFKLFQTDETAERKGKEFTKEFGGGVTLRIARAGNPEYQRQIQAEYKAHEHTLQRGQADDATEEEKRISEELSTKLVGRVMARTILLGWDDRMVKGGVHVPYSVDAAEDFLSVKEFRERVSAVAGDYKKFLVAQEGANEKNSATTSSGISSGGQASNTSAGSVTAQA